MSPDGHEHARRAIPNDDDVITEAEPGRLTIYYERIAGALDRLISLHGIEVLDRDRWAAAKARRGDGGAG